MKKILSIIMALAMVLTLTVCVAAEEVLLSEDTMFFSNGNWSEYTTEIGTDAFYAALQTPGAYLVITRSNEPSADMAYTAGGWEKFCILDAWWSGTHTLADGSTSQWIALGTANHSIALTTEGGQPYDVHVDAVLDDGIKVWYDAAEILAIWTAGNYNTAGGGDYLHIISNSSPDAVYDIVNISVVVPDAPIVAPEEAPATDEAPATEEEAPADDTTEEAPADDASEPADTGLALAVVPMLVAAAAVVISKRR